MQVFKDFKVTIVNDGGKNYKSIIKHYPIKIEEIGYKKNHTPGYARNYGLNNTSKPLIMFIDSDDVLYNPFVLSTMVANFKDDFAVLAGNIIAENADGTTRVITKNRNFLHGKLYRRSFLDKYNIRFNDSGCCEDGAFNLFCSCVANKKEMFNSINYHTYGWLYNKNSLGRKNVDEWEHCKVPKGIIDNNIMVFKELEKRGINNSIIFEEKVIAMIHATIQYVSNNIQFPQYEKENKKSTLLYYKEIYKYVEKEVSDELILSILERFKITENKEYYLNLVKNTIKSFSLE